MRKATILEKIQKEIKQLKPEEQERLVKNLSDQLGYKEWPLHKNT